MKLDFTYGMTHFHLEGVHIRLLEGVYLRLSKLRLWTNVIQHSMKVTLQGKGQLRKSSNMVSTSQYCSQTILNGSSSVTEVKEWATSIKGMKCLWKESWWYKSLVYEE